MRWAIEPAVNPHVVRIHVAHELTDRTIVTGPPAELDRPLSGLLEIEAIRTVDLHRYRIRLNLRLATDRVVAAGHARDVLAAAWGDPESLVPDPGPRAFVVEREGPRTVAESAEMAEGHPHLEAAFRVEGVSEAIAGDGMVLVRLGRLFTWEEREGPVGAALRAVTA
jgi:hypothetical protein